MARTFTQVERVDGERNQAAEKLIPVVDRLYRLQPADLGGVHSRPRTVTVRFVGAQGIERPAPVLHFEGIAKPLVLDGLNVSAMARLAGSPLQRDWLGQKAVLAVVVEEGVASIRMFSPDDPALAGLRRKGIQAERSRVRNQYARQALRVAVTFLGLIAAGYVAIYLIANWEALWAAILSVVDMLRNAS
jgi:hypothetical protein